MSRREAKRRAVRFSCRSSRVRSVGATQRGALASAATGVGATANKPPSANAPATKAEQIPCRMRRLCHSGMNMRRTATVRIYNGLPLPKFSGANKAGHACVFAALHTPLLAHLGGIADITDVSFRQLSRV